MSFAPTETWELDSLFPGGPAGDSFARAAAELDAQLRDLVARGDALPAHPHPADLASVLLRLEEVGERLEQLGTFTGCAAAADATGKDALRADARVGDLAALYARATVVPLSRVAHCSEAELEALLDFPDILHLRGYLLEQRRTVRLKLPEALESLYSELARDGIVGWGELYDVAAGALRVPVDRGNGTEQLSAGQATQLLSHPDGALREQAFGALKTAWRSIAPTCAKALTHITGTRIVLNDRRHLDPLDEPLMRAKIERRTLEAMMEAARGARPLLDRYLAAKAKALGKERLSWTDTQAPLGSASGNVGYADAQRFIVEQFQGFSPRLSQFAVRAFSERWVEVEDRPGKRGGGFCADVPQSKQSRIFMTWGNNDRSVSTLAHELGHAFHNDVLHSLPYAQRRVPMTLAETASTFGEALVREASLAQATDPQRRLRLLDGSLSDALAFLANVPSRFELELALYRMRREGSLEPDALEAETTAIFSRWYGPHVAEVDPTFWASKLHFYIAGISFYNFPYTFGYLFSALVYEFFRPLGADGAPAYERLLRRTGDEPAEPIALEELGLDLGEPTTWARALGGVRRDLDAFCALVEGN